MIVEVMDVCMEPPQMLHVSQLMATEGILSFPVKKRACTQKRNSEIRDSMVHAFAIDDPLQVRLTVRSPDGSYCGFPPEAMA